MTNDQIALVETLDKMREEIFDECQKCAFDAPKEYRRCCGRILNAATTLYEDTLKIIHTHSEIGAKTKLPLSILIELQQKVLSVLQEPETIIDREKMMQEYFAKKNIAPQKYFKTNTRINELLPTA
jgi:hypothetical protein